MPGLSDYCTNAMLDHLLHSSTTMAKPTAPLKLALFTDAITDGGVGTEVSGGAYSRQTIVFADAAAARKTANTNEVTFTASGADWGTIVSAGIFDNLGNFLAGGNLDASRVINDGDSFKFGIGDVVVSQVAWP